MIALPVSHNLPFSMQDPAQLAMMDRYNGVFSPLEISAEAFKAAYDTPDIGPHIEKARNCKKRTTKAI